MFFISLHKRDKISVTSIAVAKKFVLPLTFVFALLSGSVYAQNLVDTIEFKAKPAAQTGVAITSSSTTTTEQPAIDASNPDIDITTRQLGSTVVREFRLYGRLLYVEVTPEGSGTYYLNQGGLLSDHQKNDDFGTSPTNSWQITSW